jgi:membrane associated rhomboid family serine protease
LILLVPLRAETERLARPQVTLGLVAASVLVFLLTSLVDTRGAAADAARLERIADWTLRKAVWGQPDLERRRATYSTAMSFLEHDGTWRAEIKDLEQRATIEDCLGDYRALTAHDPFQAWGFVPAHITPLRLVTHQFLHADLLHLSVNMLFLWVVGSVLEASWGGALFLGADIASGMAAALAHALSAPGSTEPAIGASGAIAGLMGAFAVMHGREPMRVALVSMLAVAPRVHFLTLPAIVVLGFWLLEQVFYALMKAPLGIAFWAHIGGFMFGAVLALALRQLRVDQSRPV